MASVSFSKFSSVSTSALYEVSFVPLTVNLEVSNTFVLFDFKSSIALSTAVWVPDAAIEEALYTITESSFNEPIIYFLGNQI